MNTEEIKAMIEEIAAEIEALNEERQELVELLAASPSDNELWTGPDANGGYEFAPLVKLHDEFAASGDRALVYLAKTSRMFNRKWITVMDGRPMDELFMKNFNGAKGGAVFSMNFSSYQPVDTNGAGLNDYSIVFRGNMSPYEAREWFETHWASDKAHDWLRKVAERKMKNLDRQWKRKSGWPEGEADFRSMYPEYVPA